VPPLILLAAPAGYGKTTLLHEWSAKDTRPFAWLTLGPDDNEPLVLIDGVTERLEHANAIAPRSVPRPPAKGASARGTTWAALRRALGASDQPFVLVLDHAEVLSSRASLELVTALIETIPAGSQVALAARRAPGIQISRFRAEGRIVEIGGVDLAMTRAEALALLRLEGVADTRSAESLALRAEGWAGGLSIAAQVVNSNTSPLSGPPLVTGADQLLAEYVHDELLSGLKPAEIEFLVRSSVLDRLSAPTCDYVLQRNDSGRVLSALARKNMLIVPLDRNECEYRHHRLVRETLQAELHRLEPVREQRLHARASVWRDREGAVDLAVAHAIKAGDGEAAGKLIARRAPAYLAFGRRAAVSDWLATFSEEQLAASPGLALTAAATALSTGCRQGAERWLSEATLTIRTAPAGLRKPFEAESALLRAALSPDGIDGVAEEVARARRLLPERSGALTLAGFLEGSADHLQGRMKRARRHLEEGARRGASGAPSVQVLCLAQLALLAGDEGDRGNAEVLAARAKAQVERVGLSGYPTCALVYAVCADLEARAGSVDAAQRDLREAQRLLEALDDFTPWYQAECGVVLARAAVRLGDTAFARRLLGDASRITETMEAAKVLTGWIEDCWSQADAASQSTGGRWGLTTAELRVLQYLPTHLSFPMVADELYVSANTVKTHARAVYRKLDASSRGEAVLRAREAGLLDAEVATQTA
jgi:LuxR family maltose regulon positive regulatory protein